MPQTKNNASKKKTLNDLCASFTDAGNEAVNLEDSSDDPVNELIDILRNATSSYQNLNESDIAAIKVTNLIIPAVNFISAKTVAKSNNAQNSKISKICSGLRINSYEIDKQNQYCRENLRIIGLTENEEENCFDILKSLCMAMRRGSLPQGWSQEEGGTPYVDCTLFIQRFESSDTYGKKTFERQHKLF